MNFQEAEETGLTKLVYIPFHNQHAGIVRLIRHYGDLYINVLKQYFNDFGTTIGFHTDIGKAKEEPESSWEEFHNYIQGLTNKLKATRLVHLKPVDLYVDEEGLVSLVCEYESKGLDKYIPEHIKAIYHCPVDLVDKLINGEEPESSLWEFAPIGFIAPCFGEYITE